MFHWNVMILCTVVIAVVISGIRMNSIYKILVNENIDKYGKCNSYLWHYFSMRVIFDLLQSGTRFFLKIFSETVLVISS